MRHNDDDDDEDDDDEIWRHLRRILKFARVGIFSLLRSFVVVVVVIIFSFSRFFSYLSNFFS